MNGFLLLMPFFGIRFILLSILNRKSIQRAAYFAPMQGNEKVAYFIYQISTIGIILYLFFLTIKIDFSLRFFLGLISYLVGLCLCAITIINFSSPDSKGLIQMGFIDFPVIPCI